MCGQQDDQISGDYLDKEAWADGDLRMEGGSLVRTWQTQSGSMWFRAGWDGYRNDAELN